MRASSGLAGSHDVGFVFYIPYLATYTLNAELEHLNTKAPAASEVLETLELVTNYTWIHLVPSRCRMEVDAETRQSFRSLQQTSMCLLIQSGPTILGCTISGLGNQFTSMDGFFLSGVSGSGTSE